MATLSGPVRLVPSKMRAVSSEQNVQGFERVASLAGGLLMIGRGIRRGGIPGWLQAAVGGLTLARGISGHCSTKAFIVDHRSDLAEIRQRLEAATHTLAKLQAEATRAALKKS